MSYSIYNQRDYPNIPYPAPGYESATVYSAGCGPVSMSMVVENLVGVGFPPPVAVELALSCGARISGATDIPTLARAAGKIFPLKYSFTTSVDTMLSKVRYNRAMAIAHTKGGAAGLFSDSGHYVVVAGVGDPYVIVLDPYMYAGKFDKAPRKGKAILGPDGAVRVKPADLAADCKAYYIFEREESKMTVGEAKEIIREKAGLSDKTIEYLWSYRWGDELILKLTEAMKGGEDK